MAQDNQLKRVIELGVSQANNNARDLTLAIAALAQENARARVGADSITDLTDSTDGTAGTALVPVVTPTIATVAGTTSMAPKAAFDTQIGIIEDAHRELAVKANEMIDAIVPGSTITKVEDLTSGAAANDTMAEITAALTGTATAGEGVDANTGIREINTARNNQSAVCAAINWCRVAQGLAPISDNSGGVFTKTAALYQTTDAVATATAAVANANSLTDATVDAALAALRNNISTLADALTDANAPAIGPFVVATNNAQTRFATGDVTV